MIELNKAYSHKEVEDKWYAQWEKDNLFHAGRNPRKKPFCIVIPPPNVTGILHMGHALNDTIQDILVRYHRMKGEESLWMPGTDHAGIATQNVVEKSIAKEGLKRQDLGRDKFLERVWEWKDKYGSTIIRQLKKLGASCDWSRTRFTMDEAYSDSVMEVFVRLYEKGLIYQGSRIINWCPRCQTALADEEAPHHDLEGNLYYINYPVKGEADTFVTVATTRPETMLGDTAVAVNPKDRRYKKIAGKTLILPLVDREIPVIADDMVDRKFGTGAVKITPAHDPNDYATAKRHDLEFINVMNPDGTMNKNAGEYMGKDRFEAREVILEDLKELGLLQKIEPHPLSAGHCYRCHTIIEPYLSKQWFVKMEPLARPAIEAVKSGKIKFHPKRWTKVYLNWMENIQDWCISRQIWWGHRIPVYYCANCPDKLIVSKTRPDKCPYCGGTDLRQDEDVLDTWFSSWLWPFATFGWPFKSSALKDPENANADLEYFYPTSTLVTAPEIIFFWVARMIMAGYEFMKDLPFSDVYIHGTVRDAEGRKMSKSLGNSIDPLEIIEQYGTDALRYSIISITAQGQDVFLAKERFEMGRNFCNKIWNASRFVLMNLNNDEVKNALPQLASEKLSPMNKWMLSRYNLTVKETRKLLESYKFNEAATLLYRFFWHEFCDWYLEMVKTEISVGQTQAVLYTVLEGFLRLIHPFTPFITEEIWQKLSPGGSSVMVEAYPAANEKAIDRKNDIRMEKAFEMITAVRNMRAEMGVPLTAEINAVVAVPDKGLREMLSSIHGIFRNLTKTKDLRVTDTFAPIKGSITSVIGDIHVSIPLEGVVDIEKEKAKLDEKIKKTEQEIKAKQGLLSSKNFVERAPEEIVEKEKARLEELTQTLNKLKGVKHGLSD
ncbi:MAG: valine--tRNA ligase [Deltaproteobacteria bacterium]